MSTEHPLLSLVVPAYDEREGTEDILAFFHEVAAAVSDLRVEMVVVDDGSTDGTSERLAQLLKPGDAVRIVRLSRNFGSHAAISAGLAHVRGDAALTLSADRQEPLEAVLRFVEQWRAGADLVWGVRSVRASKGGGNELFAKAFSRVFHSASTVPTYPREGPSQILVTRPVIDVLTAMPEVNRNVLAMAAWTGFDQRYVAFEQMPRPHGVSKWTSAKKIKLVIDSFVEFSAQPVRWLALVGVVLGASGGLLLVLGLVLALAGRDGLGAALSGLVLAVGGLVLVGVSVVGEYVWRAGDDARGRPVFVVREVIDAPGDTSG